MEYCSWDHTFDDTSVVCLPFVALQGIVQQQTEDHFVDWGQLLAVDYRHLGQRPWELPAVADSLGHQLFAHAD